MTAGTGGRTRPPAMSPVTRSHRLGPWRRTLQWAATVALLLVPFVRLGGESLLRVDLASRSLLFFGRVLRLEELYLFLLVVVGVLLSWLLVTLVFGRVWCGWACPQTTLSDLVEWFSRRIGARVRGGSIIARPWQIPLLHGFYGALALLVAANGVWYFISPYAFFPLLVRGALPGPAVGALALLAAAVYLDLAFVRRDFCRTVCPYGRLQSALLDAGTLTLRLLPEEADRCIQCRSCLRACPTGVDIREGYQVACINCGRCRDACLEVMERRGEQGLIGYTFGLEGRGPRALFTPRTAVVTLAAVAVLSALALAASTRAPLGLSVRRTAAPVRTLAAGGRAVFFTGYASNRGQQPVRVTVTARGPDGGPLEVRGLAVDVPLGPGEHRQLDLAVVLPSDTPAPVYPVTFRLEAPGTGQAVETDVQLHLAPTSRPPGGRS